MYMIDNDMMAGCQVGRDPSMLAAYIIIITCIKHNTKKKEKEREREKHNIITPLDIYNGRLK